MGINADGSTRTGAITHIFVFDDIDSYNTNSYSDDQIMTLDTFKAWNPRNAHTIYRTNKPLCRQMKVGWQDTNVSLTSVIPLP